MTAELAARTAHSLQVSRLDWYIIELAQTNARGTRVSFSNAVRALQEAAEEAIPTGRIFFLGTENNTPIIGSLVSGVGIVETELGIRLVRVRLGVNVTPLGWFSR